MKISKNQQNNLRLLKDKIKTKIQDIFNQLESIGEPFDVLTIKERFLGNRKEKGLLEVFDSVLKNIEARIDKDYSLGTLKHYRTTQKRLVEFIRLRTERKDIALSKIDFNFLNSFDVFLKTEKNVMPNTALTYHKHLKKVLNTAIASGFISQCPYNSFKPTRNETNRDFLTLQELNHIQSKKIDISRLDFIRNIFVFASSI